MMKRMFKPISRFTALAGLGLLSALSLAQSFTQADLEKMVKELEVYSPKFPEYVYPIKASIVENEEPNAYATVEKNKDGKWQPIMVVFTGFVKFTNADLRLIRACVAHEISHLAKGHCTMPGWKPSDLNNLWTRQQEFEADVAGASLLQKAGYSKQDMADLMLKLDDLSKGSTWLGKLTGDHASGKARAAEILDNPLILRSLMDFEVGLAFMESRGYQQAMDAFDRAIKKEPKLGEAYTNSAQAAIMFYYDNLPKDVKANWFKPDFGPMLAPPPVGSRDPFIRAEDRQRWEAARQRVAAAIQVNKDDLRTLELAALILVLDPDGNPANLKAGTDGLKSLVNENLVPELKLRVANNAALGMQRSGQLKDAVALLLNAQKGITVYNPYLAENLGINELSKGADDLNTVAEAVLATWLDNTAPAHPEYTKIKGNYTKFCSAAGFKPRDFKQQPVFLSKVMSVNDKGTDLGMFDPFEKFIETLGKPDGALKYDDRYPDLMEVRWNNGQFAVLTERDEVLRVTTYSPTGSITLKSVDTTLNWSFKITIGMTKADFAKVLNPDNARKVNLIKTGSMEEWHYWPNLKMGVLFTDDKIAGLTAAAAGK